NNVDGNWISGINFIDSPRLGPQDKLPENKINKGTNKFYFLPLILGLIGLLFHFKRRYQDGIIVMLLFIMTGVAIVVYLNQYSPQPRERDYSFAASFYAFSIWIGLGVLMVTEWLQKFMDSKKSAIVATGLCLLLVPGVMAKDGWNDHDRSGRYAALAIAKNFLESCDKNAILFTVGDNDTFPLWYAQEVEGIRRDIRVVNLSLLSGDWYINQMRKKAYESDPLPISLRPEQYRASNREVTYLVEQPNIQGFQDIKDIFDIIDNHETAFQQVNEGEKFDFIPTKNFSIKADTAFIRKNGMIPAFYRDSIVPAINFTVNQDVLMRSDLIILDIIAHNNWKRPVYFSAAVPSDALQGLSEYTLQEGVAYRLVPAHIKGSDGQTGGVNTAVMYHNLMDKFFWRNLNNPHVYLDETCHRLATNYRNAFGRLAFGLAEEGQNAKAVKVLDYCMQIFPEKQLPFDYFALQMAYAYAKAGDINKAAAIWDRMMTLSKENIDYSMRTNVKNGEKMDGDTQQYMYYLQKIIQDAAKAGKTDTEKKARTLFEDYYSRLF
ncbi:MAG: DUF2723 domain-containing protein, partial [Bacteroidota bacterium]|nr:DUF2723 domain-containing protein [Bacteroidota bacterium]